ncbi:hypothetical protein MBUL_00897 [Methylobacterium bullatum]|uniref:Chromosome partition protein Smc n=1 Tax=Methylobacterium bullatum TaxID=570505 RepID=A0A679IV93_9HYPH|nr:hypothetical protein MBUL_00897 [Methylobacterium bullatum]
MEGTAPERLDAEASPALVALADALKRARAPLLSALERAGNLRGEIDALTARIEAGEGEIEAAEHARAAEREALRLAELTANGETVRVSGLAERVVSLGREIAPYLAAAGLSLADLDRDGAGTARRVAEIAAAHRALDRNRESSSARSRPSRRAAPAPPKPWASPAPPPMRPDARRWPAPTGSPGCGPNGRLC